MRQARFRIVVTAATVVFALVSGVRSAVASGGPPPPSSSSAISQYVEVIPTASGATESGRGTTNKPAHLSPTAQRALTTDGASAAPLRSIATSPAYGAPSDATPLERPTAGRRLLHPQSKHRSTKPAASTDGTSFGASVSALGTGATPLIAVAILIVVITAAAVAAAATSRRVKTVTR